MSNLYSVIPSLTPGANDVLEAELLAKQILEAEFPDLDLREGTGLRDLVLRPTAFAMALLRKASDYYFAQNTLKGVNDTTDTEIVDDILSNWFLSRHTGTNAMISARLYFARSKNVTLPSSVYFSTDNTLKFFPVSTQTFQATSLGYDSYQNEWYIDVPLIAESTGTEYNLSSGSMLYFTNFDPYFLHAEINYLSQSSTTAETNSEFIARSQSAISTRNLINSPSIISNLQSAFNTLDRITPVGMGDPDMIRDQIKVIIDPEDPRLLTSLTQTAGVAMATLGDHNFEVGQQVVIVGAIPVEYNGQFVVTAKTANTFSFTVDSGLAAASIIPTVQSYTAPNLVHTGGMVDVYCGDDLSANVIQLTTDSAGIATLNGPIFEFSRSSITGGAADDTIPFTTPVTISGKVLNSGPKTISVTSTGPHGLTNGYQIAVTGVVQTKVVTTITCTNLVVTVTSASHALTSGMQVTVSGVLPVTYNGTFTITVIDTNTFTYVLSANVLVAGSGASMKISNPACTGNFVVTYTGTNTFDIYFANMWSGATDDIAALAVTHSVSYTVINPNLQTKTLASLTGTGTTAIATLVNHGYAAGRYVTISGATPSYYNGTWKIRASLSSTQFSFDITSTILASATGTITSQYTVPWNDVGFSTHQNLLINFGAAYPNQTASFETQYFTHVGDVQDHLETADNHVLCGNYLARGYNLYVLDLNVVVYNGSAPATGLIQITSDTYLKTLPAGSTLVVSDLVSALNKAGVVNIQTPIGVNYTAYHRDLITPKTGSVVDYLDPLDKTSVFVLGNITTSSLNV